MIIVVHCHGAENGKFPNWTPVKPTDQPLGPVPTMFYFAVHPTASANRLTDVYARNLILNMDGVHPALATNGQHLTFTDGTAVGPDDFIPNVTPGKPIGVAARANDIITALETAIKAAGGPVWDSPTCRLWPDAAVGQKPLADYSLQPYASGGGGYTPNAAWGEWPANSGGPLNGRVNPNGRVWCVNTPQSTLSKTVQKAWQDSKSAGLMGPCAVVCLFCRS